MKKADVQDLIKAILEGDFKDWNDGCACDDYGRDL